MTSAKDPFKHYLQGWLTENRNQSFYFILFHLCRRVLDTTFTRCGRTAAFCFTLRQHPGVSLHWIKACISGALSLSTFPKPNPGANLLTGGPLNDKWCPIVYCKEVGLLSRLKKKLNYLLQHVCEKETEDTGSRALMWLHPHPVHDVMRNVDTSQTILLLIIYSFTFANAL